jgi:hypothetical protein
LLCSTIFRPAATSQPITLSARLLEIRRARMRMPAAGTATHTEILLLALANGVEPGRCPAGKNN